jgi:hypothetical protein
MGKRHFVAVHTDSGCIFGCDHKHQNVTTATACISQPGGYIVAVRRRKYLPLSELEETEFQKAMFGREETPEQASDAAMLLKRKLNPQE